MWHCGKCQQEIENDLVVCWNCGTSKMGVEDPGFKNVEALEAEVTGESEESRKTETESWPVLSCGKCGEKKVMPDRPIRDSVGTMGETQLQVLSHRNPGAVIFKGTAASRLFANVCGNCGHTEIFASDPEGLWAAYEESKKA